MWQRLFVGLRTIGGLKAVLAGIAFLPAILTYVVAWFEGMPWAQRITLASLALAAGLVIVWVGLSLYDRFFAPEKPVEFRDILNRAQKRNWHFGGESLDIIDLMDALVQSAVNGEIVFWGRSDRNMFQALTRNEPLERIPSEHWKDFCINWGAGLKTKGLVFQGIVDDNFEICSYTLRHEGLRGFKDLHVQGVSSRWFKNAEKKFRGRRKKQDEQKRKEMQRREDAERVEIQAGDGQPPI